jgi:hypothetical protein
MRVAWASLVRGHTPQATYIFKHALIQDTAYQSLLKSTRLQYHRQIAQVLVNHFPETAEAQPELVAHHYTEASLSAQAVPYWQRAGERATQHSAHAEAISHLTKGLALLQTLPDLAARAQQELTLHVALGAPLMATKGWAAPEAEHAFTRARELCRRLGETPQLFPVLAGLAAVYHVRGEHTIARELGEQMMWLAQSTQRPPFLLIAHYTPISAGQKRSTFLGLPEKLPGTGRPPGESDTRKRLIDFPRVERSTRDVKVQLPQEPQADQTTATAVCQAQHRRRCVAQSPLLNHPRGTIN